MAVDVQGQRHNRKALILYGSETGNSQDVAEELGRMAERLHFITRVSEMDLVEINALLDYTVVLFAVSTTGQGEFPQNAKKFWKSLLRKRLPPDCLSHVAFTTFGLGDSSYPQFNFAARKLHKRLEQLGAKEVYPRGEADEQHDQGIDGTFLSWSADIRKHLLSLYPLPDGVTPIPQEVLLPPKLILALQEKVPGPPQVSTGSQIHQANQIHHPAVSPQPAINDSSGQSPGVQSKPETPEPSKQAANQIKMERTPSRSIYDFPIPVEEEPVICNQLREKFDGEPHDDPDSTFPPSKAIVLSNSFNVLMLENKRMTPENHWQDVRQLTFGLSDEEAYDPGDVINIMPKNFPEDVQTLIDLMDWNKVADIPVTFVASPPDFYLADNLLSKAPGLFPTPNSTLRDLLIHNLDITAIPKRYFFELIAHNTDDPMHKERLLEFTNPALSDEFYDYTSRPRRGILEVLQDFPSVKLPWQQATQFFPVIRPRKFSISSGGTLKTSSTPGMIKFQLLVAIVKYKTVLKKVRQGLCSRYLAAMPKNTPLKVTLTDGSLGFEATKAYKPLILIGPGTGVAPCRALIWERASEALFDTKIATEETILFYGGRNKRADYFYAHEWKFHHLALTHVFTAFSRDQKEKIYVQDIIRREKKEVWRMIAKGGIIVVCGSSGKMPKAVREAILWVMLEEGGVEKFPKGREDVEAELKKMEKRKHYVQETW
ncbi:NADPH-dependent diflavin oxidoreductase [Lachnellula subtilissima]|uniref:NADPH-dependent diflavin oxidoreductase 1 n=1 Tax=Lachnellula subtilissima TaxID=602034 RepID=A0A8H8RI72_9HELO|nr:NADPH-dependent diflavin oxidoreductase [Lachnellula subtilissima]